MVSTDEDSLAALFLRHGLRCTSQRRALYRALTTTDSHPTVDHLHRSVSSQIAGISLATAYNTLEAFCRAGLAAKLPGTNGPGPAGSARYDAVVDDHVHARCEKTGAVRDVPDHVSRKILGCIPPEMLTQVEAKMGFKIKQVRIELVGESRE